jgi:hypothetical protein
MSLTKYLFIGLISLVAIKGYSAETVFTQLNHVGVIPIIQGDDPEQTREAIEEVLATFGVVSHDNPAASGQDVSYLVIESFPDAKLPVITVRMKLKAQSQLTSNPAYPITGIAFQKHVLVDGLTKDLGKVQKVVREMLEELKSKYDHCGGEVNGRPVPTFYVATVKTS